MDYVVIAAMAGSVYALLSLGYALVYSSLRLINFAHGEFCMLGAYLALGVLQILGCSAWVALAAALAGGGIAAAVTWFVAYRPLQKAERSSAILAAIGASICLQQIVSRSVGAKSRAFSLSLWDGRVAVAGVDLDSTSVLCVGSMLAVLGLIHVLWRHTHVGLAVRAVADDRDAAESVGISSQRVVLWTFLLAGTVAGIAGVVLATSLSRVEPTMGFAPGLKAFVAALAGGLHDPRKAALGGLFLGIAETLAVVAGLSAYRDALVLLVLVGILLVQAQLQEHSPLLRASLVEED